MPDVGDQYEDERKYDECGTDPSERAAFRDEPVTTDDQQQDPEKTETRQGQTGPAFRCDNHDDSRCHGDQRCPGQPHPASLRPLGPGGCSWRYRLAGHDCHLADPIAEVVRCSTLRNADDEYRIVRE